MHPYYCVFLLDHTSAKFCIFSYLTSSPAQAHIPSSEPLKILSPGLSASFASIDPLPGRMSKPQCSFKPPDGSTLSAGCSELAGLGCVRLCNPSLERLQRHPSSTLFVLCLLFCLVLFLGIKPRASLTLVKPSTTQPHLQLLFLFFILRQSHCDPDWP